MATSSTDMQTAALAMADAATTVLDTLARSVDTPYEKVKDVNTALKAARAVIAALTPA